MATKIERIQDLLADVEIDIKKATAKDIVIDLNDFLDSATSDEKDGLRAAIEIIKANYL